jgi:hypothetical protein
MILSNQWNILQEKLRLIYKTRVHNCTKIWGIIGCVPTLQDDSHTSFKKHRTGRTRSSNTRNTKTYRLLHSWSQFRSLSFLREKLHESCVSIYIYIYIYIYNVTELRPKVLHYEIHWHFCLQRPPSQTKLIKARKNNWHSQVYKQIFRYVSIGRRLPGRQRKRWFETVTGHYV